MCEELTDIEPNQETLEAMKDVEACRTEGPIDASSVEVMLNSMDLSAPNTIAYKNYQ